MALWSIFAQVVIFGDGWSCKNLSVRPRIFGKNDTNWMIQTAYLTSEETDNCVYMYVTNHNCFRPLLRLCLVSVIRLYGSNSHFHYCTGAFWTFYIGQKCCWIDQHLFRPCFILASMRVCGTFGWIVVVVSLSVTICETVELKDPTQKRLAASKRSSFEA